MTRLDEVQMNRLIHTKALFERAVRISYEPHPYSADSLLLFHDSVENLLHQAAGFLRVELQKSSTFDSYWKESQTQKSVTLPARGPMKRMNDARVQFKHHGLIPSGSTVEQVRADATSFFTDAVPQVFGIDFDQISMDLLLTNSTVRQLLNRADALADRHTVESLAAAMLYLHDAFRSLLAEFIRPGSGGVDFPTLRRNSAGKDWEGLLHIINADVFIQEYYWPVFLLGLDYREYDQFISWTPRHHEGAMWEGTQTAPETPLWYEPKFMTAENYALSRTFVARAGIRAGHLGGLRHRFSVRSGETLQTNLRALLAKAKA